MLVVFVYQYLHNHDNKHAHGDIALAHCHSGQCLLNHESPRQSTDDDTLSQRRCPSRQQNTNKKGSNDGLLFLEP